MIERDALKRALAELSVASYTLKGTPQNEAEFNRMFQPHAGRDGRGVLIRERDPRRFPVTWETVQAKVAELERTVMAEERQARAANAEASRLRHNILTALARGDTPDRAEQARLAALLDRLPS